MSFLSLSSSRGTVLEATLQAIQAGSLHNPCLGLITDRADRGCITVAKKFSLPVVIVERAKGEDRETYDKRLDAAIESLTPDPTLRPTIACMGWMYLFSPWFVGMRRGHILNVHPSLLPKYPGAHAHELVLAAGERESGMTIHFIDEGLDTGKIIVQKKCSVLPSDTVDTLQARVQKLECEWYPKVLEQLRTTT